MTFRFYFKILVAFICVCCCPAQLVIAQPTIPSLLVVQAPTLQSEFPSGEFLDVINTAVDYLKEHEDVQHIGIIAKDAPTANCAQIILRSYFRKKKKW